MSLDTFANVADIVSVPIGIVGLILVLHQLYLTRLESEKEHLRMKNEMTLNAYSTVRKDLQKITTKVRNKLDIDDMFDDVTEEQIDMIMSDKNLRQDVSEMLSLLNKFAVGVKHDIFSIDIINELSGKYFIKTHKQFKPYIKRARENVDTLYSEYDVLVENLKKMRDHQRQGVSLRDRNKKSSVFESMKNIIVSSSTTLLETFIIIGIVIMFFVIGVVYFNNIHALPTIFIKIIIGFFILIMILIIIQLFYAFKEYFGLYNKEK